MRSFFAASGCLLLLTCPAPAQGVAPDSIGRLIDVADLPLPSPQVTCRQFASTDPTGQGEDHGHFLRRQGNTAVLAEMTGPGVIVRLWSANAAGRLRVFCDGEDTPRIDGPFADLFTGELPPFTPPIATHASGGFISYWPIPYRKSCRVEVAELEHPDALYYQVQYLTYAAGTPLRTFTRELPAAEQQALQRVLQFWRQPGESPLPAAGGDREAEATVTVGPGESREFFIADEPGTVTTLRLLPKNATADQLRSLLLSASWDGGEPSVQAPLADFFGVGFGVTPYRGLLLGWDRRGGYCHLPMPFHERARLTLRNVGDADVQVDTVVRWRPGPPAATAMALHAECRATDGVGDELYEIAAVPGPGKFVGVTQTLQGVGDLWYLEGNERFFVDGESAPSIVGTGTEDFYNGGWYWNEGPFAQPLHGLGRKEEWTTNRTTPWRLQLADAVPFRNGFVARIEHGSVNEVRDAYYASVAFWYAPARGVREVPAAATRVPRLWVPRPPGFVGAHELAWAAEPAVVWRRWEDVTSTHRGLARPLFQAFPRSHVEHDQPAVDARIATMPAAATTERTFRAHFKAPFADRYRLHLRLLATTVLPQLRLDGANLALPAGDAGPLRACDLDAGALTAGEHELAFVVPAGAETPIGLDALRLVSAAPFVRTWWVAPPTPAAPQGTVEDRLPPEARYLAPDFDPAAAGWKRVTATGDGLDLNREVSAQSPMLAYLLIDVHSPAARTVRALLGSDDGARVWCNGELCWSHEIHRPLAADQDQFDVGLQAGWNRLLLKIKNDYGGYGVMLRVADPDGTLRFAHERR